jgi:hypothetical protein
MYSKLAYLFDVPFNRIIKQPILLVVALIVTNLIHGQVIYDGSGGGYFNGNIIGKVSGSNFYNGSGKKIGKVTGNYLSSTWGNCVVYDASGRKIGSINADDIYNSAGSKIGQMNCLDGGNDDTYFLDGRGRKMGTLSRVLYNSKGKETRIIRDYSNSVIGTTEGLSRKEVIVFFYFFM